MLPLQQPPPIWVVSNPRIKGEMPPKVMTRRMEQACRRIVQLGDGWLTCCRARHPEEVREQLSAIRDAAVANGRDPDAFSVAYQVTMHIGDSKTSAKTAFAEYIGRYYPELSQVVDLEEWGPVGTPDDIADWIRTFASAGVDTFICRFGAVDQSVQTARFAREVLPRFRA